MSNDGADFVVPVQVTFTFFFQTALTRISEILLEVL